ncbi:E3 ubiquitin-protein ligase SIAH1A [Anabrus simplex]|uniref:E3 ubiquitin-protein ligase SIAH1A n=1 Tax=Anabrus simplex TaxID=316456 RepID=UPI0034DD277E
MSDPAEELEKINRNLLQQLECPVCTNYLLPPIEQCQNGHSICQQCRVKVRHCPSCKVLFCGIRNRFAENIAETLPYPCENQNAGCSVTVLSKYLLLHQHRCQFRMHHCLAGKGMGCLWRGQKSQLARHVKSEHPELCIMGSKATLRVPMLGDQNASASYRLMFAHGEMFWLSEKHEQDNSLSLYVKYIGPEERAKNYKYQIRFVSRNGNHELINTHVTHCDFEDISGRSQGVNLNYFLIQPYQDDNAMLTYTVKLLNCWSSSYLTLSIFIFIVSVFLYLITQQDFYSYSWCDEMSDTKSVALQL